MKITDPIIEVDTHGLNVEQALKRVESAVLKAPEGTYRIRVIHGFNSGTRIKTAVRNEYTFDLTGRVLRVIPGDNMGVTELVLKEY